MPKDKKQHGMKTSSPVALFANELSIKVDFIKHFFAITGENKILQISDFKIFIFMI